MNGVSYLPPVARVGVPPAVKERIAMLRESYLHKPEVQDWVGMWWGKLAKDDRRTLLALAGLDDSTAMASRAWRQLLQSDRDTLLTECKRFQRLTEAVRWA
jgi:hypothetical protein